MGLAYYEVAPSGDEWTVVHDGRNEGRFETKEAAFEAAATAASLAIRQGHKVSVTAPGSEAGNGTSLGGPSN